MYFLEFPAKKDSYIIIIMLVEDIQIRLDPIIVITYVSSFNSSLDDLDSRYIQTLACGDVQVKMARLRVHLPQVQLTGAGGHGGRCCLQTGCRTSPFSAGGVGFFRYLHQLSTWCNGPKVKPIHRKT